MAKDVRPLILQAAEECADVIRDYAMMAGEHPAYFSMLVLDALAFTLIQVNSLQYDRHPHKMAKIHHDQVMKFIRAYARDHPDG
jgi:hypothetical protein